MPTMLEKDNSNELPDAFLEQFLGYLSDPKFSKAGDLTSYLSTTADRQIGDERNIVDNRVTRKLIEALGYADNEIDQDEQKDNLRPDFKVSIKEYPFRACFIIEDKKTSIRDLQAHRPQLYSYMAQTGAPSGMLINGRAILVYDQADNGQQAPTTIIPLDEAVAAWRGENILSEKGTTKKAALETAGLLPSLSSLWRRFGNY